MSVRWGAFFLAVLTVAQTLSPLPSSSATSSTVMGWASWKTAFASSLDCSSGLGCRWLALFQQPPSCVGPTNPACLAKRPLANSGFRTHAFRSFECPASERAFFRGRRLALRDQASGQRAERGDSGGDSVGLSGDQQGAGKSGQRNGPKSERLRPPAEKNIPLRAPRVRARDDTNKEEVVGVSIILSGEECRVYRPVIEHHKRRSQKWAINIPLVSGVLSGPDITEEDLNTVVKRIMEASVDMEPFKIEVRDCNLVLERGLWGVAKIPRNQQLIELQKCLAEIFPIIGGVQASGDSWSPTISLGPFARRGDGFAAFEKIKSNWKPMNISVRSISVLTTKGYGNFIEHETVPLSPLNASDGRSGLRELQKWHRDRLEKEKKILMSARKILKMENAYERLERINFDRIDYLAGLNLSMEDPLSAPGATDKVDVTSDTNLSNEISAEVTELEPSGTEAMGGEVTDDDEEEEGELLQEGDDEGVLLALTKAAEDEASTESAASLVAKEEQEFGDQSQSTFIELTRRVLQDLASTVEDPVDPSQKGLDIGSLREAVKEQSESEQKNGQKQPGARGKGRGARRGLSTVARVRADRFRGRGGTQQPGRGRIGQALRGTRGQRGQFRGNKSGSASTRERSESATCILLVRHGQSIWNAEGRWQGQADTPLSDLGAAQSAIAALRLCSRGGALLGGSLRDIKAVYASDMLRANQTATILASQAGLGPIVCDNRLRERSVGEWSGLTYDEVQQQWPGYLKKRLLPPSYETDDLVLPRVFAALDAVRKDHPGEQVMIVCHAGIIYAVEAYLKAKDGKRNPHRRYRIGNLGCRWVVWDGKGFRLGKRVNLLGEGPIRKPPV